MWQQEHLKFLRQRYFTMLPLRHTVYDLTWAEKEILFRYGNWLNALMNGILNAETTGQRHFLAVCKSEVQPENEIERIWKRYLQNIEMDKTFDNLTWFNPDNTHVDVEPDWACPKCKGSGLYGNCSACGGSGLRQD